MVLSTDFKNLVSALRKCKSDKDMADFLEGILTAQEREAIPKRLKVVEMLKGGITHRKIAAELGVGIATVTRGSKEIKSNKFKNVS